MRAIRILFFAAHLFPVLLLAGEIILHPIEGPPRVHAEDYDTSFYTANERSAIGALYECATAEENFRRMDHDEDGINEYAQSLRGPWRSALDVNLAALPEPSAEEKTKIDALLKQLSAEDFDAREHAVKALENYGEKAGRQMQEIANSSKEFEPVERCKSLLAKIAQAQTGVRTDGSGLFSTKSKGGTVEIKLVSREIAQAECTVDMNSRNVPDKSGYLFRVLLNRGANTGRSTSFIKERNGAPHMLFGYAFVAFPKNYGPENRHVFLIMDGGRVHQKDFGSRQKTEEYIRNCDSYNPDSTWKFLVASPKSAVP